MKTTLNINDFVGKHIYIEVGSGTTAKVWTKDEFTQQIRNAISNNFLDWEFYYNWTDDAQGDEYRNVFFNETMPLLTKNYNKCLNTYFVYGRTPSSRLTDVLTFNVHYKEARKYIDKWFVTNTSISSKLREAYFYYRREYAGVELDTNKK